MRPNARIVLLAAIAVCFAAVLWVTVESRRDKTNLTYSQLLERLRSGQVASVTVQNPKPAEAISRMNDGATARTLLPPDFESVLSAIREQGVDVRFQESPGFRSILLNATPFLVLLATWIFLMVRKFPNWPKIGV